MSTKLTLTLDNTIIQNAKKYAKIYNISLSKMVEFYFKSLVTDMPSKEYKIPPITKALSGMAKLSTAKTDKELLIEALNKKHL